MASPTSRIATAHDVPVLLPMMESYNALERIPWNAAAKERALRVLLGDDSLGLVAMLELAQACVGYFVLTWSYDLEWNGRDAFLTEIFLLPTARGQGWGGTALDLAESLAQGHSARALHLMVLPENTVARRLYARHGYASPARLFLSKELTS